MKRILIGLLVLGVGWGGFQIKRMMADPEMHLFLLAGQSNMAGRGLVSAEHQISISGVMALQQDGSWGPAVDPVHWDKAKAGVGLARSFARAYLAENPGVEIGFIPTACGGSPVEVWAPGQYFESTQSHPYDDAIARAKLVNPRGVLKGMLWHQGEADSHPGRVEHYHDRLVDLFDRFRNDLEKPDLPILVGQLGQFPGAEWTPERREIDSIHQRIAAADPLVGFVPSDGLSSQEDLLHFDTAGLDEFGRRYAAVWARLAASPVK